MAQDQDDRHFLREDHGAHVGPITPGAGAKDSTVIAEREALWRSSPAGLDCRAPAGLAMTSFRRQIPATSGLFSRHSRKGGYR